MLLSAHPHVMVVGEIGSELGMPGSSLSHHLEKLKNEDLVSVKRESTFLRYSANTETLQELRVSSTRSAARGIRQLRSPADYANSAHNRTRMLFVYLLIQENSHEHNDRH